jgi:hypothetical protein
VGRWCDWDSKSSAPKTEEDDDDVLPLLDRPETTIHPTKRWASSHFRRQSRRVVAVPVVFPTHFPVGVPSWCFTIRKERRIVPQTASRTSSSVSGQFFPSRRRDDRCGHDRKSRLRRPSMGGGSPDSRRDFTAQLSNRQPWNHGPHEGVSKIVRRSQRSTSSLKH